jgi:DNA-binding transcriptional LysR family regulator
MAGRSHVEAFRSVGLDVPRKNIISFSVHVQIGLAATQRFFTILPDSMLRSSARRLSITTIPINLEIRPQNVGIVMLKKRTVSATAQEFIQMARDITKSQRSRLPK